jgi:diguanylate cyclase (GGDEF)-like protein/PAS domain S-box-containing protein
MSKPPDTLFADAAMGLAPPTPGAVIQTATWLIENSAQATVLLNLAAPDAPVVHANPAFVHLIGAKTTDAVLGRTLPELLGVDSSGEDWLALTRCLARGMPAQLQCLAHGLTHESFRAHLACHVLATGIAVGADDAALTGAENAAGGANLNGHAAGLAMAIVLDQSAEWLASRQRLTQTRRLDALLTSMDDAVVQVDSAMVLNGINPAAESLTGWSEAAAKGLPVGDVLRFVDRLTGDPLGNPLLATLLSGEETGWVSNAALCRADGGEIPVAYRTAVVHDADGMAVEALLLMRNHSDASVLAKAMAHSAWHDALTGLPNRSVFEDRLSQAYALAERYKHPYGLLLVDIDGMDPLTESQGHASAQDLLKAVAEHLRKVFRRCDTVCRVADARFAVVLPVLNTLASEALLESKALTAQDALAPFNSDGLPLTLRVAAAISQDDIKGSHAPSSESTEQLVQRATGRLLDGYTPRTA